MRQLLSFLFILLSISSYAQVHINDDGKTIVVGEGLLENEGKIIGRSDNTLVLEQGSVFEMVSGQIE